MCGYCTKSLTRLNNISQSIIIKKFEIETKLYATSNSLCVSFYNSAYINKPRGTKWSCKLNCSSWTGDKTHQPIQLVMCIIIITSIYWLCGNVCTCISWAKLEGIINCMISWLIHNFKHLILLKYILFVYAHT